MGEGQEVTVVFDSTRMGPVLAAYILSKRFDNCRLVREHGPVTTVSFNGQGVFVGTLPLGQTSSPHEQAVHLCEWINIVGLQPRSVQKRIMTSSLVESALDHKLWDRPAILPSEHGLMPYLSAYELGMHVCSCPVSRIGQLVEHILFREVSDPIAACDAVVERALEIITAPEESCGVENADFCPREYRTRFGKVAVCDGFLSDNDAMKAVSQYGPELAFVVSDARAEGWKSLWGHGDMAIAGLFGMALGRQGHAMVPSDVFEEWLTNEAQNQGS